jgi:hypothetical protein
MVESVTNGLTQGDFTTLRVLSSAGVMTDIISLIGSSGAGGGLSDVTSASSQLTVATSGSTRVLTLNLSAYSTSAQMNTALASKLSALVGAGAAVISGTGTSRTITVDLTGYSTTAQMNTALATKQPVLTAGTSIQLNGATISSTALAAVQAVLPLVVSTTPTTATLSSLWTPSQLSVSSGLVGVFSNALGTYSLALTGTESRTALKLADSGGTVRDLTTSTAGVLTWASAPMLTEAQVKALIATSVTAAPTSGLTSTGQNSTGAVQIAINQTWTWPSLRISDGASSYKTVTADSSALKFDGSALATTANLATEVATINTSLGTKQPIVAGLSQTGTTSSLETTISGRAFLLDANSAGANQCEMRWKYDTGAGSYLFSNSSFLGIIPASGQTLRFYGTGGNSALDIPSGTVNVVIAGSLTAASKSFDIAQDWRTDATTGEEYRLRHWCYEGDEQGGSLIYRRQLTAPKAGIVDLFMPPWFQHLAKDVLVFANGFRHHGTAWAEQDELDPCVIHVNCSRGGLFNVLVTAARKDTCALACPPDVEYLAPEKEIPTV